MTDHLSLAQARRVALAAQGFLDPPHAVPTMRTLTRAVGRTGVLQVDSVNVLQRAHLVPLYSRLGPYDPGLLERASTGRQQRRLVEYWAHVQALMPVDLWPVMRHRMEQHRSRRHKWFDGLDLSLETALLAEVRDRGACTARDLDAGLPRVREHWGWNWSETRKVLDYLYMVGELAIAGRNGQFEVRYDLPERVLPDAVLAAPTPTAAEAARELVRRAARSHGVATETDLRDYYRMGVDETRRAVAELVEAGELRVVEVDGWRRPTYLHPEARFPRRVAARTLVSPFDPLVWERDRTERLFGFRYRIEIYVPAAQRVHGYYVLPFLLGERLAARVDLKADRPARRLLVRAAFAEADAPSGTAAEVAGELAAELTRMAGWLGLDADVPVLVEPRGDLAPALAHALRSG